MSVQGASTFKSKVTTTLAIASAVPVLGLMGYYMAELRPQVPEAHRGDATRNAALTGLAALAAMAGFAVWAGRRLAQPLDALAAAALAGAPDPSLTDRSDAIGFMAREIAELRRSAMAAESMRGELAACREDLNREKARAESERAEARKDYASVIDAVTTGVQRLSDGDLSYRIDQSLGAHEGLRSNFNAALSQLQQMVRAILEGSETIRSGTSEISRASDDLSRRTEQQAASLEETAAALDEITATVQKTASGAKQASEAVTSTRADAEKGGAVVREAVTAMSEIERSSQQVGQIIGVIDEIAFQTNLLALNAGVEAARAGDAGRGFAVVASEVRALAQRSADAAKEIKQLISRSNDQVSTGVELVGETGQALERIFQRVAEIDGLVSEIAVSVQEQSSGLSQVNIAVNQMDQATQQNAAMVEESTAATRALTQEAEHLASVAGRFQVGRATAKAPVRATASPARAMASPARTTASLARAASAPIRSQPAPEPRPAPQAASPARPTPSAAPAKRALGGRAAALLAESNDADNWEEF